MKYLVQLAFIFSCISAQSQNFNFDTLPQFKYKNVISFQGYTSPSAVGLFYSRNFWSGMGYRNYEEVSIGACYGKQGLYDYHNKYDHIPTFSYDLKLQHNMRFSLKRLLYFSIVVGYAPLIPIRESQLATFDDYMNSGYGLIGISGSAKRVVFGLYFGVSITERRQDLFYSVHTYAQVKPHVRLKIGYSFGDKYKNSD